MFGSSNLTCPLFFYIHLSYRVPYSAAAILQAAKANGRCVKSLLCFLCFHWKCAVGFLHIYMCCVCDWFTQIVVENPSFFQKIYSCG